MKLTVEQVFDDLTGERLVESASADIVITTEGKQYAWSLDFEPQTLDALIAAFESHDYAKIRKLFSGEPAPKGPAPKEPKKEPRVRDPEGKDRRAWMREHGFPDIKERGNLPKEAIAAYEAAHKTT